jgi:hypothetical protein
MHQCSYSMWLLLKALVQHVMILLNHFSQFHIKYKMQNSFFCMKIIYSKFFIMASHKYAYI